MRHKGIKIGVMLVTAVMLLEGCQGAEQKQTTEMTTSAPSEAATTEEAETDSQEQQNPLASQNDNPSLRAFATQDLDGNKVTQELFKDYDLTMLNVWSTSCGPCLREMSDLGELSEEYKEKGLQIAGVVADAIDQDKNLVEDQVTLAKIAAEKTKANYIHLLPSMDLINGALKEVSMVPTTIFVDKDGNQVGEVYTEAKTKEEWKAIVEELLTQVQ